jgi:hypothetical protein
MGILTAALNLVTTFGYSFHNITSTQIASEGESLRISMNVGIIFKRYEQPKA